MELRDGFIVGIFNYCDRWCEACPLTSRCRVFADVAEFEASLDPTLRPLTRVPSWSVPGPPRSESAPEGDALSMLALAAMDDARESGVGSRECGTGGDGEGVMARAPEPLPEDLAEMTAHAERYRERVCAWLRSDPARNRSDPADPLAVVAWGHTMIGAKLAGAFAFAEPGQPADEEDAADSDGRVKAALLAIDRSHTAWLSLVEAGTIPMTEAAIFVAELVWLGRALEDRFPRARAFVRPGFDEPDIVAALERGEWP